MKYRSNEEVRREFREHVGDVPEHAKYIINKYTKDACCVMCGHPAQPNTVVNKLEDFIIDGRSSDLDAIIEGLPKEDKPKLGSENQEIYVAYSNGYNSAIAEMREYLNSLK